MKIEYFVGITRGVLWSYNWDDIRNMGSYAVLLKNAMAQQIVHIKMDFRFWRYFFVLELDESSFQIVF